MSEEPRERRAVPKRRITTGLAVLLAALALLAGVAIGYVARGGPGAPALVTTDQELTQVTVTVDQNAP